MANKYFVEATGGAKGFEVCYPSPFNPEPQDGGLNNDRFCN